MKTADLVKILKGNYSGPLKLADRLKFVYRPYICPFDVLLPLIKENDSLLDIGCGQGQFILLAAKTVNPLKIAGIEISNALIEKCEEMIKQNGLGNASVSIYNGFDLPDFSREYNVFTMIDILHHIPEAKQWDYLENLYKTLKKGDLLILKDINAGSILHIFNKLHDFVVSREASREKKACDVLSFCEKLGFKAELFKKKRMLVYPHFILTLRK